MIDADPRPAPAGLPHHGVPGWPAARAAGALPRPPDDRRFEVSRRLRALRGGVSDAGDRSERRAPHRSRSLPLLHGLRERVSGGCAPLQRRPSAGGPRARGPDRRVGSRARARRGPARSAAPALRPLPQAAPGERRRLQRVRARRERAEHRGLGPEPLRDPVRRVAPPRRRPADHRRDLARTCSWRCARPTTRFRSPRS